MNKIAFAAIVAVAVVLIWATWDSESHFPQLVVGASLAVPAAIALACPAQPGGPKKNGSTMRGYMMTETEAEANNMEWALKGDKDLSDADIKTLNDTPANKNRLKVFATELKNAGNATDAITRLGNGLLKITDVKRVCDALRTAVGDDGKAAVAFSICDNDDVASAQQRIFMCNGDNMHTAFLRTPGTGGDLTAAAGAHGIKSIYYIVPVNANAGSDITKLYHLSFVCDGVNVTRNSHSSAAKKATYNAHSHAQMNSFIEKVLGVKGQCIPSGANISTENKFDKVEWNTVCTAANGRAAAPP